MSDNIQIGKEDWKEFKDEVKNDFRNLFDRLNGIDKSFTAYSQLTDERLRQGNDRFEKMEIMMKQAQLDIREHIQSNLQNESVILFVDSNKKTLENMLNWYTERIETGKQIKREVRSNAVKYAFAGIIGLIALIPAIEKFLRLIGIIK